MKIWTDQSQKFTLSFLPFLKLLKKVIREKLQPPWKYYPLEPATPHPTPPKMWFSNITQPFLSSGGVVTMKSVHTTQQWLECCKCSVLFLLIK